MKKKILSGYILFTVFFMARASTSFNIKRIDPPDWWVGMKDTSLQLCVYGKNISACKVSVNYAGVRIKDVIEPENPDYLFIDLSISPSTQPGQFNLIFTSGKVRNEYPYQLSLREQSMGRYQGFSSKDLLYLIMPDRFANGDTTNDIVKGMRETTLHRDSIFGRHGGDIQGVIDHLDYIKGLGVTAIWLTPVLENNEPIASYHGYGFTDHYKVDPRLGNNELYQKLVREAHAKGLKIIMDVVFNHVGDRNWFYLDPPMPDWIHHSDSFLQTSFRITSLMDTHASEYDKNKLSNGWFVRHMPDLNQQNPFLANYLIQNALWWIEKTGIDGFRMDTYAYSDLDFMNRLLEAIKNEYPNFNFVGEVWDHAVPFQAWLTKNANIKKAFNSELPGCTDFQLCFALHEALTKPMDWTGGLTKLYYVLAQDFLYSKPENNLVFADNHDMSRFYSVIGEDLRKFKMGLAYILTTRGIPCIYYGTEILMKNFADPDGKVRSDFPGGWKQDKVNKFTETGRTTEENEIFNYIQKLAFYRQSNDALQTGKLTQFVPENNTYVYFRSNKNSTVMIVMYTGEKKGALALNRFNEMFTTFTRGKDIMDGNEINLNKPLQLEPYSIGIYELQK